jgi:hypothetical protein
MIVQIFGGHLNAGFRSHLINTGSDLIKHDSLKKFLSSYSRKPLGTAKFGGSAQIEYSPF